MKIEYRGFRSSTQEAEVKAFLDELSELIPRKVIRLTVLNWDSTEDGGGVAAAITYDLHYLYATLHIYNQFFASSKDKQEETIIHEISHLHTAEYFSFVQQDILQYVKEHNEPLAEQFSRMLEKAEEVLVTQVSHFIAESISASRRN